MRVKPILAVVVFAVCLILSSCATSTDVENAYDRGFEAGEETGYERGYREGSNDTWDSAYFEGREDAIDDLHEEYSDGQLIYMSDEAIDQLTYILEDENGFEYNAEDYFLIVEDYLLKNGDRLTPDEIEAFENVVEYFYDVERLMRRIYNGE